MVPPYSHGISRAPWYSGYRSPTHIFVYRTLTFFGVPSHALQLTFIDTLMRSIPRCCKQLRFGLFHFRSPLLAESRLISFPRPTKMFQFGRFPSYTYLFSIRWQGLTPAGFLHSEICGSIRICQSPQLIAAYRVLRRLPMPRHPPCALKSLTNHRIFVIT